jgi:hypothetical protein
MRCHHDLAAVVDEFGKAGQHGQATAHGQRGFRFVQQVQALWPKAMRHQVHERLAV